MSYGGSSPLAPTILTTPFSRTNTGTVIAAVPGKKIRVFAIKLLVSAALSISWRDGGSDALEGAQTFGVNGGYVESASPPSYLFQTTAGNSLDLVISGTGTAAGRLSYWLSD